MTPTIGPWKPWADEAVRASAKSWLDAPFRGSSLPQHVTRGVTGSSPAARGDGITTALAPKFVAI